MKSKHEMEINRNVIRAEGKKQNSLLLLHLLIREQRPRYFIKISSEY
jgi:hypothetical protein